MCDRYCSLVMVIPLGWYTVLSSGEKIPTFISHHSHYFTSHSSRRPCAVDVLRRRFRQSLNRFWANRKRECLQGRLPSPVVINFLSTSNNIIFMYFFFLPLKVNLITLVYLFCFVFQKRQIIII